jgi:hypothetical protein
MASDAHPAQPFAPRVVTDAAAELEQRALTMRTAGKSYTNIARALGLGGPREAHDTFSRAVRHQPSKERAALRSAESSRLDKLAKKTKARADLTAEQVARRLRSIERLRQTVMSD